MLKIATHNSATGEKGRGFLSWLLTPFAKTQSKTIKEQYEAGCRLFDIRVKLHRGQFVCAHGLWNTKRTAEDIINELNNFDDIVFVEIMYEGNNKKQEAFERFIRYIKSTYTHINYGNIKVKYGPGSKGLKLQECVIIPKDDDFIMCGMKSNFLGLNGRCWQTYIPIPWIWKKIYFDKPEFSEDYYTWVDFL